MRRFAREDSAIRGTNDDATLGKWSCVQKRYYRDSFLTHFVVGVDKESAVVFPPLMNRGHWARVRCVELLVERFVQSASKGPKQLVVLGAGNDTLFFRLSETGRAQNLRCFEVDFEEIVNRKRAAMNADPVFMDYLKCPERYALFSCDLRNIEAFSSSLNTLGFRNDVPTFFLSECVLIYMTPEEGNALIRWTAESTTESVFVTYEQVYPDDAFGKTMIRNLESRNIPLHSIMKFKDPSAQIDRYREAKFEWVLCRTMFDLYNSFLPREEVDRISRLEVFDEYEEWRLVLSHYCIVTAVKGPESLRRGLDFSVGMNQEV